MILWEIFRPQRLDRMGFWSELSEVIPERIRKDWLLKSQIKNPDRVKSAIFSRELFYKRCLHVLDFQI